jgi:hypothetical protein
VEVVDEVDVSGLVVVNSVVTIVVDSVAVVVSSVDEDGAKNRVTIVIIK